jgi:hypothetical protein
MVDIALSASDDCPELTGFVTVTSSEPVNDVGDGNFEPDIIIGSTSTVTQNYPYHSVEGPVTMIDGKYTVQLRAEDQGLKH